MKGGKVKVGMFGLGVVGTGVAQEFARIKPSDMSLDVVVVRDLSRPREVQVPHLTTNPDEILEDPSIDIVVELMGGYDPAREYITKAMQNGKHVVTANKAVFSQYGPELIELAKSHGANIGLEGAVGGGILIINPLLERYRHADITGITAIINGTTNFILTRMSEKMDFGQALSLAQRDGFAEKDPSSDVEGFDAAYKIALLASLAFGGWVYPNQVHTQGITQITPADIDYAQDLGYVVKLLATARKTGKGEVDIGVYPTLLNKSHPLAPINDETNAIYIEGKPFKRALHFGYGAGSGPTAFSVYGDIAMLAEMARTNILRPINIGGTATIANQDEIETQGYFRLHLLDASGSFLKVAEVLAHHGISMRDSIQRGGSKYELVVDGKTYVPDIITHHPVPLGVIKKALSDLQQLRVENGGPIAGEPFYMRMQNNHKGA